jgi:hypothetical protein
VAINNILLRLFLEAVRRSGTFMTFRDETLRNKICLKCVEIQLRASLMLKMFHCYIFDDLSLTRGRRGWKNERRAEIECYEERERQEGEGGKRWRRERTTKEWERRVRSKS